MDMFNILAQNIHCGYTLEPPRRGGSNDYPQCMFWIKSKNKRTNGHINAHLRPEIYILINLFDYNGNMHAYNPRAGSK